MSDIDLAVRKCQRLEQILQRDLGAAGKGLHQKVSSAEAILPAPLVRKLRLVATVRNKVVHESARIEDRKEFVAAADEAERELKALAKSRRGGAIFGVRTLITVIALLMFIAAVVFVYLLLR